ncbi:MAG: ABC transporter permease [Gammaproteobacteria bacterium]|nr:ABC transporter permease [Gammaproteobacteria bacterium]
MRRLPNELGILVVLIFVGLVFSLLSNQFMTAGNLFTMLLNVTVIALLSLGQTFVLLTGGIDLSVGSGIALSGVLAAMVLQSNGTLWEAVAVAILSTLALGLVNGVIIHYVKVPPFITTFATMSVTASIPMILTQANPIAIVKQGFAQIGGGFLGPIPIPVLILGVLALLAWLFLTRTSLGVHIYATGGNRDAARLAGVNTAKVDLLVYVVSGLMSGLCGLIDASRLMSGFPTAGSGTSLFFSYRGRRGWRCQSVRWRGIDCRGPDRVCPHRHHHGRIEHHQREQLLAAIGDRAHHSDCRDGGYTSDVPASASSHCGSFPATVEKRFKAASRNGSRLILCL